MRLAFLTGSLVHGGAERQAITLANRLAERGHECHAIYVKNDPSQLGRLRRKKGHAETWSGQVRRLDRRGSRSDSYIMGILILGLAVAALSAGGTVLIVFVLTALVAIAWRRARPRRR